MSQFHETEDLPGGVGTASEYAPAVHIDWFSDEWFFRYFTLTESRRGDPLTSDPRARTVVGLPSYGT